MKKIYLNSPARIHLGFLELDPKSNRNFGSLGLAINSFPTIIEGNLFTKNIINKEKEKFNEIISNIQSRYEIQPCKIKINKSSPEHSGLGSGTQLALSIGIILTKLSQKKISVNQVAKILERGKRSGIGINCFKKGGFIIDSGKIKGKNNVPSIIFHNKWPKNWKLILIIDNNAKKIFGKRESKKFKKLNKVKSNFSSQNCKSVLMKIMPSIKEKNFADFCSGIQEIQENTGHAFAKFQGGMYSSKNVGKIFNELEKMGIKGYGQSSWGPTGFVLCENALEQKSLIEEIRKILKKNSINNINLLKTEGRNYGYKFE
tara:strand:- start:1608 stop:2555 length:948 start_codon:yes stop_codon:yes gene_type:complete